MRRDQRGINPASEPSGHWEVFLPRVDSAPIVTCIIWSSAGDCWLLPPRLAYDFVLGIRPSRAADRADNLPLVDQWNTAS
jgi:hypothetical protein